MHMPRFVPAVALALFAAAVLTGAAKDDKPKAIDKKAVEALKPLRDLVGDWRGVGLPRRGSTDGAWQEKAEWSYTFDEKATALTFNATTAKYFSKGRIEPGEKAGTFVFVGTLPDGKKTERFTGSLDDRGALVVENPKADDGRPDRIMFRIVAQGDRLVVLLTRKSGSTNARLAQVGYTREGSNFGGTGTANECVVTGGESSRTVTYKGKSYYVCCKGCADYFAENAEEVIAEYEAKKAKEKKDAKEKG